MRKILLIMQTKSRQHKLVTEDIAPIGVLLAHYATRKTKDSESKKASVSGLSRLEASTVREGEGDKEI